MQFSRAFLVALFAALASAQQADGPNSFNVPENGGYSLNAGEPQVFNWGNQAGDTVTLRLRFGNSGDLDDGDVIASNIPNTGTYTWNVPDNIPRGTSYTVEIINDQDDSQTNFTPPFTINSDTVGEPGLPDGDDDNDDDDSSSSSSATDTSTITSSASTSSATDSSSTSASTTTDDDDDDDSSSTSTTESSTRTTGSNEPTPTGDSQVPGESDGAAAAIQVGGSLLAVLGAMVAVM